MCRRDSHNEVVLRAAASTVDIDLCAGTVGVSCVRPGAGESDSRNRWLTPVITCSAGALILVSMVNLTIVCGNKRSRRHQVHGVESTQQSQCAPGEACLHFLLCPGHVCAKGTTPGGYRCDSRCSLVLLSSLERIIMGFDARFVSVLTGTNHASVPDACCTCNHPCISTCSHEYMFLFSVPRGTCVVEGYDQLTWGRGNVQ